jgi:primosomal protein N' (replication factor Y)
MACQVVPDIPTFAVDDGFTYNIPDGLPVTVGSMVRIKVSGRRRAGFVTAVFPRPEGRKLLDVDGISGNTPVFDEDLLDVCRWASTHYVAPLSTVFRRTTPPNVPRSVAVADAASGGGRGTGRLVCVVSASPHVEAVLGALAESGPRPIIVPTAHEATEMAAKLRESVDMPVVLATSSMTGADLTKAWAIACHNPGSVLVGTREVALWPVASKRGWIVVEDGRRVMKSPSTPTLNVREIARRRCRDTNGDLTIISPVPTLETMHMGATITHPPGRAWSAVEVVDRTEEPPGSSLFTARVRHAITTAVAGGSVVFVLVTARGYAPAFRCLDCSELRMCQSCGTHATSSDSCRRCGEPLKACTSCGGHRFGPLGAGIGLVVDDVARFVDPGLIASADERRQVRVGSERDLVGLSDVGLGVVVDFDGMAGAPHYRATEDALRLLARLGQAVDRGPGHRLIIQTSRTDQELLKALVSGHSEHFLAAEMERRKSADFPPFGSLIAMEVDVDHDADELIRSAVGSSATVRGPARMRDRMRWLIQGDDLTVARISLRAAVGGLRQQGARVRVDADPIDL